MRISLAGATKKQLETVLKGIAAETVNHGDEAVIYYPDGSVAVFHFRDEWVMSESYRLVPSMKGDQR